MNNGNLIKKSPNKIRTILFSIIILTLPQNINCLVESNSLPLLGSYKP